MSDYAIRRYAALDEKEKKRLNPTSVVKQSTEYAYSPNLVLCECKQHYLTYCNLCRRMTSCDLCGCARCELIAKENSSALDLAPDEERRVLTTVSKRTVNPRRAEKVFRRKKRRANRGVRNYLDDILDS